MSDPVTEIVLIRHGETAWNAEGRVQGHVDIPLNSTGLVQAQALAEKFAGESIQAIYSSDLDRAYQTARPVARYGNHVIQRDSRLRERHLGVLQGLTREEAMVTQPATWELFKARCPDASLEGGESLKVLFQRVTQFLFELCHRHVGQRVLLVTHGGILDAAYRHAVGMPLDAPRDFPIRNASINVLKCKAQEWCIEQWGDVSHLSVHTLSESA